MYDAITFIENTYSLSMRQLLFYFITIQFMLQVSFQLPEYVHEHTSAEMNLTAVVLVHKPSTCVSSQDSHKKVLIAIKTAVTHHNRRNVLRQTWLTHVVLKNIPYVFVLGTSINDDEMKNLQMEHEKYNDLLIGKFIDNYYNLTLKTTFAIFWTKTYCPNYWLLYVDDDTIVNIMNVLNFIESVQNTSTYAIYCNRYFNGPIRSIKSKWFVPYIVWNNTDYPQLCHGFGTLMPPYVLPRLYETAMNNSVRPKLWLDDVFITGIVRNAAGVEIVQGPFSFGHKDTVEDYNKNLVLAASGSDNKFSEQWQIIIGIFSNFTKIPTIVQISSTVRQKSNSEHHFQQKKQIVVDTTQFFTSKDMCEPWYKSSIVYFIFILLFIVFFRKPCNRKLKLFFQYFQRSFVKHRFSCPLFMENNH